MINIIKQIFGSGEASKAKQISGWLGALAEMDDLDALRYSTQNLAQSLSNPGEHLKHHIDLILALETANQPRLDRLSTQFVRVENMKVDIENNMSETSYNYCRQSYIYHLKIIELAIHPDKYKLESDVSALLIARAINCAFNMVKWRLFSQTSAPTKVWLQIYMLYRIAHQQNLLYTVLELFNLSIPTTLSAHFVQICMLGQLAQANMQKHHVEIAARFLKASLARARISNKYSPEQYLFFIDLEKDSAAKRMRQYEPNDYTGEHCRYWDLDDLEKIISVAKTVTQRGEIPISLMFSDIESAKKLHETLCIIHSEWTKKEYVRQRRTLSRQATSKTAKVNAGIVNICNQVHQANQISKGLRLSRHGATFDDRLQAHTILRQTTSISAVSNSLDTWIITDESFKGLGTRVNKFANILARPNKLIGLIIGEDPSKVVIGMITATKATHGNQLKVGVEIISHHPSWVQLKMLPNNERFPNTKAEIGEKTQTAYVDIGVFSGIYLPIETGLSDKSTLILPKVSYRPNAFYAITVDEVTRQVELGVAIESRDDWVKVTFPF